MKKRIIAGCVCGVLAICLIVLFSSDILRGPEVKPASDLPSKTDISAEAAKDLSEVPEDIAAKLQEAKDINDDTKGWLYIPDTPVDYPVVQYEDNEYYTRRGLDGNYNFEGVLFFDYMDKVTGSFKDFTQNTIIYGHNTTTSGIGTEMFASLLNYEDQAYAEAHPYLYLVTDEGQSVWEIFAGFHTDIDFYYIENEPDEQAFKDMVDTAKRRSTFTYEVTPSGDDKILTLSTCAYKYRTAAQGDERFVIMARQIENPTSDDIREIKVTPNTSMEEPVFS